MTREDLHDISVVAELKLSKTAKKGINYVDLHDISVVAELKHYDKQNFYDRGTISTTSASWPN